MRTTGREDCRQCGEPIPGGEWTRYPDYPMCGDCEREVMDRDDLPGERRNAGWDGEPEEWDVVGGL